MNERQQVVHEALRVELCYLIRALHWQPQQRAGKGPTDPLSANTTWSSVPRIKRQAVGPVRQLSHLLSTASETDFVQLNGLAIFVGQEPAAENRVTAERKRSTIRILTMGLT
jgi:hypothetical protein